MTRPFKSRQTPRVLRSIAREGIAALSTAVSSTSAAVLPGLEMTAPGLDHSPEQDILAKISGALDVLEHRRGSALIPAACARRLRIHHMAAMPPFL